jgi:hypothetical protein
MRLAIIGSRTFDDFNRLAYIVQTHFCRQTTDRYEPIFTEIISGGAVGADKMGEKIALDFGVRLTVFKPDWEGLGKRAGFARNQTIIENCDYVLCAWDGVSKGTAHSLSISKRLKKTTMIIYF